MDNNYKKFLLGNSILHQTKNYLIATSLFLSCFFFTQKTLAQGPIQNATVTSTNGLLNVAYSYRNNSCPNANRGNITINTINGANFSGYSFQWLDISSERTNLRNNLTFGDYEVEITEIANSANKGNIKITITSPPNFRVDNEPLNRPKCSGGVGSTNITRVNGGTPFATGDPYKYKWYKDVLPPSTVVIGTSLNYTGLPGKYILKYEDANGCGSDYSTEIEDAPAFVYPAPESTNNVNFLDRNGKITIKVTGGTPAPAPNPYTYEWTFNGAPAPEYDKFEHTGLRSGVYTVRLKDGNGCFSIAQTINIEPLKQFEVPDPVPKNNTCKTTPNGSITFNITGGKAPYKVNFSDGFSVSGLFNGNYTRPNLDKNTYSGTVTDAFGVSLPFGAIRIDGPDAIDFPLVEHTNNTCFLGELGTITLKVSGGTPPYRYILKKGTAPADAPVVLSETPFTINNLKSGSYTVSIIDNGGCPTPAQSVDILPLAPLTFTSVIPNRIICGLANSGRIDAVVSGGYGDYVYEWSNSTGVIPNETSASLIGRTSGIYSLKVTDKLGLGCPITRNNIEIINNSSPLIVSEIAGSKVNNGCYKDNFGVINKNGKVNIKVDNGSGNFEYKFLLNDVDVTPTITITPGRVDVSNLQSGLYKLFVKDLFDGCAADVFPFVITPVDPIGFGEIVKHETCVDANNGKIDLNPTGVTIGATYTWVDAPLITDPFRRDLSPGDYTAIIFDNLCSVRKKFTILPATPVEISDEIKIVLPNCDGSVPFSTITVPIEGGEPDYTYTWSTADPKTGAIIANLPTVPQNPLLPNDIAFKEGLAAGYYVLTVTDANGCETKLPVFDAAKALNAFEIKAISCGAVNNAITPDPLISPNGDGINDFFSINGIEKFPDNQVIIYNRYGTEVFTRRRYNNVDRIFTGIANSALTNTGTNLVDGVYFYTIRTVQDKKPRLNKGYIIIKR
jgi:gliding motility-associated-like protein